MGSMRYNSFSVRRFSTASSLVFDFISLAYLVKRIVIRFTHVMYQANRTKLVNVKMTCKDVNKANRKSASSLMVDREFLSSSDEL